MKRYTLVSYTLNGKEAISAIHDYDLFKFLAEHPDAKIIKK